MDEIGRLMHVRHVHNCRHGCPWPYVGSRRVAQSQSLQRRRGAKDAPGIGHRHTVGSPGRLFSVLYLVAVVLDFASASAPPAHSGRNLAIACLAANNHVFMQRVSAEECNDQGRRTSASHPATQWQESGEF